MRYYPIFDNLFDDFFTTDSQGTSSVMKTDIVEKDGNYELSIEMPGVKKEDIQMELKDNNLKVIALTTKTKKIKKVVLFVKNVLSVLILVHSMLEMMYVQKMLKPLSVMKNWLSQFLKKHQRKLKTTNLFLLNSRYAHRYSFISRHNKNA